MKTKIIFSILLIVLTCCLSQCKKKKHDPIRGCTDPNSLNYNPDATENDGSCTYAPTFSVGQMYGGGMVFYVDASGHHGLIVALTDQGTYCDWGCQGTDLAGCTGTAVGTGQQNTNEIMTGCSTSTIAARVCDQLSLSGYNDWYLPSVGELQQMWNNKNLIGGFAPEAYWSSTEIDVTYARGISFATTGTWYGLPKDGNNGRVRAIRAF